MEYFEKWLTEFQLFIAGIAGAFVATRFHSDLKTLVQVVTFLISGGAIAYYMTGICALYLNMPAQAAGGIAFLLGAFGGSLIAAFTRAIQSADIWAVIKARLGVK